ncbi:unnamed protein product [Closterium sp. NIES-64]|nr:unnamed protein product [Closterium sp. NIES-64]
MRGLSFACPSATALCVTPVQRLAVLTGAGVSAASGVPTFRGAGGLWRTYDATELATPQAFAADPSLVWEFYHYRRSVVAWCTPNAGHEALVQLEFRCQREGKAFTLLTQGAPSEGAKAASIALKDLPRCTKLSGSAASSRPCNGLLRPDVVWFGECLDPRVVQAAEDALTGCDLLLVVGTSGVVHALTGASSGVCSGGAGGRGAGAEFNAEATALSPLATWKFPGDSAMLLPLVLG